MAPLDSLMKTDRVKWRKKSVNMTYTPYTFNDRFNTDKLSNSDGVKFLFSTSKLNKSVFIKSFSYQLFFQLYGDLRLIGNSYFDQLLH